jgi:hypothetical protein
MSKASFEQNANDVELLLGVHEFLGGTDAGRRGPAEQVLNRSGVVLVCAIWEAYCEDLASEALDHLVTNVSGPDALPVQLRRRVAKELKLDAHELSPWRLAGDGWKRHVTRRLDDLRVDRNRGLNAPKAANIQTLFDGALGIDDITANWFWSNMSRTRARDKLNEYVTLRGEIAHRGSVPGVQKGRVEGFLNHVARLAAKTDDTVNEFVESQCGTPLYA